MDRPIAYDKLAPRGPVRPDAHARRGLAQGRPGDAAVPGPVEPRVDVRPGARHPGRRAPGDGGGRPHRVRLSRRALGIHHGHGASGLGRVTPRRDVPGPARAPRRLRRRVPRDDLLWRCACAEDAAARVAGVNRGLEGLACDVFNQLIHIAKKIEDPMLERSVDYVLADEITHVRMGSRWLNELTEGDPERRRRADRVPGARSTIASTSAASGRRPPRRRCRSRSPPRTRAAGRLHRRGDRAARQEHAALPGVLARAARPARRSLRASTSPPDASATIATSRSG